MTRRGVGRCRCGYVKSIHLRMYVAPKGRKLRSCNYPGCKCRNYTVENNSRGKRKGA